jgi:hypothetical protein
VGRCVCHIQVLRLETTVSPCPVGGSRKESTPDAAIILQHLDQRSMVMNAPILFSSLKFRLRSHGFFVNDHLWLDDQLYNRAQNNSIKTPASILLLQTGCYSRCFVPLERGRFGRTLRVSASQNCQRRRRNCCTGLADIKIEFFSACYPPAQPWQIGILLTSLSLCPWRYCLMIL